MRKAEKSASRRASRPRSRRSGDDADSERAAARTAAGNFRSKGEPPRRITERSSAARASPARKQPAEAPHSRSADDDRPVPAHTGRLCAPKRETRRRSGRGRPPGALPPSGAAACAIRRTGLRRPSIPVPAHFPESSGSHPERRRGYPAKASSPYPHGPSVYSSTNLACTLYSSLMVLKSSGSSPADAPSAMSADTFMARMTGALL